MLTALAASIGGPAIAVSQAAASHAQIQGSGSTWSSNAVNQWISDVTSQGLQVVFSGVGSAQGRTDFAQQVTDFGVTDIGFQGTDPGTGAQDTNCSTQTKICRPYAYEPIVAGGTSFPYHILVAGQLVRSLRLSPQTLTKIFTYQITNWDDPAITADNNGHALPSLQIVPVVHSEGSGSSAQFTTFMNTEFPSIWQPFAKVSSFLEYYPAPVHGQAGVAQNGSDGVMNFVSSAAANGAIGYDEYSYPLAQNWPVAAILNKGGYYTLPTQYNVAVALQHAQINMDKSSPNYLLETLNNVYTATEPQVYPLSSYSYFLIPTGSGSVETRMSTAKRQSLADFLFYAVCQGQKEIGPIGYSPLPSNLVAASFSQTVLLNGADAGVNVTQEQNTQLASCNNPTFVPGNLSVNRLAQIAPLPLACQKQGQGPCTNNGLEPGTTAGGTSGNTGSTGGTTGSTGGTTGSAGGSGSTGTTGTTGTAGSTTGTANNTTNLLGGGTSNDAGSGSANNAVAQPTNLADSAQLIGVLGPLAVLLILAVLVVPPTIYFFVLAPRRTSS